MLHSACERAQSECQQQLRSSYITSSYILVTSSYILVTSSYILVTSSYITSSYIVLSDARDTFPGVVRELRAGGAAHEGEYSPVHVPDPHRGPQPPPAGAVHALPATPQRHRRVLRRRARQDKGAAPRHARAQGRRQAGA
eukprot:4827394-Pyramimonas_sp.AAC.1